MDAKTLLGKELKVIVKDDLELFFKERQYENSKVEYKAGKVEVEKICEEICAFLNTDGGILIIGAPIEIEDENKEKYSQGKLTPSSKINNEINLMKMIGSKITPSPSNIEIRKLPEINVFVIEVKRSNYPPHQVVQKGAYYMRFGTESKPAPHGFVETLFNKRNFASLEIILNEVKKIEFNKISIQILVKNKSIYPSEGVQMIVNASNVNNISTPNKKKSNNIKGTHYLPSHKEELILWKGMINSYYFIIETLPKDFTFHLTVCSPNAEPKSLEFVYSVKDEKIKNQKLF